MNILKMFDVGFARRTPEHRYQVKPTGLVVRATLLHEVAGCVLQTSPLRGMDGLVEHLRRVTRSRFDFYKDQRVGITADQIDLASGTSIVAHKDAEPLLLEMPGSGSFAAATETMGWVTPPLQPVQSTKFLSYGREAHGPYAPSRLAYAGNTV